MALSLHFRKTFFHSRKLHRSWAQWPRADIWWLILSGKRMIFNLGPLLGFRRACIIPERHAGWIYDFIHSFIAAATQRREERERRLCCWISPPGPLWSSRKIAKRKLKNTMNIGGWEREENAGGKRGHCWFIFACKMFLFVLQVDETRW